MLYPGWSAHFRIEPWDNTRDVPYRVRHGEQAMFEGLIRKDPIDKDVIVVGSLSCNSNNDRGDRDTIVENLKKQDPDLLFFAGDQSYDHKEHTAAWLLWGRQFREIIKDRPVVTIPDDHDIGQGNLWGEGGIVADSPAGDSGGYFYPAEYIRMVERCQTWHLPDPADPRPVAQGIGVVLHAAARRRRRFRRDRGPQVQERVRRARFRKWARGRTTSRRPATTRRRSICPVWNSWASGNWRF